LKKYAALEKGMQELVDKRFEPYSGRKDNPVVAVRQTETPQKLCNATLSDYESRKRRHNDELNPEKRVQSHERAVRSCRQSLFGIPVCF